MTDPYLELAQTIRLATEAFDGFDPASLADIDREDLLALIEMLDGAGDEQKGLAGRVSLVLSAVKTELVSRMEYDEEQVGDYLLTRRWGKSRKGFDNRGLYRAVAERACVDPETGEVLPDRERSLVERGVEFVQRFVPSPSNAWNAKPLRAAGIDLDAYCKDVAEAKASLVVKRHVATEEVA